jgi:hypothetical protein
MILAGFFRTAGFLVEITPAGANSFAITFIEPSPT